VTPSPEAGIVLAETGSTGSGEGIGAVLLLIGLLAMIAGAIAWRRRIA
jgi:hypothetical protein